MKKDFTIVLGVDRRTLDQLQIVLPTWKLCKPSLFDRRVVVFYDQTELDSSVVRAAIDLPSFSLVEWPWEDAVYSGDGKSKWTLSQRHKMLAGFVHVPAQFVQTRYWLKLDTDAVATGVDNWINNDWFDEEPGIVAQRWGYTKPVNQMSYLDKWAETYDMSGHALGIPVGDGATKLVHPRIASWCGFFSQQLTAIAAAYAEKHCGRGQIPVPSQDGYHWYMSKRLGYKVVRANFKNRGWAVKSTTKGVTDLAQSVLGGLG